MHAYKWVSEHTNSVSCDYPLIIIKSKTMIGKLVLAAITLLVQQDICSSAEFTMIPSTTTAAELWNPYTWFWPYAIASAESYRDYFSKAQKATNELYQQIYATNANPLITGNWGVTSPVQKPADNITQSNYTQGSSNQTVSGGDKNENIETSSPESQKPNNATTDS